MPPRLSPLETTLLAAFAHEVRARFGPRVRALTLFGSRARGAGHDESDLDVFVLIDGMSREDRRDVIDLAADLGLDSNLILSPLVADAGAWREDFPIAAEIAADGVPL